MTDSEGSGGGALPPAQAVDLLGLVDYADGAIVSRTLAENEAGTLTLFAFDAGQGLSEHATPFDAVLTVLDGAAEVVIEGKSHRVKAGEVIVMPADKPHAVSAPEKLRMLLVMIRS